MLTLLEAPELADRYCFFFAVVVPILWFVWRHIFNDWRHITFVLRRAVFLPTVSFYLSINFWVCDLWISLIFHVNWWLEFRLFLLRRLAFGHDLIERFRLLIIWILDLLHKSHIVLISYCLKLFVDGWKDASLRGAHWTIISLAHLLRVIHWLLRLYLFELSYSLDILSYRIFFILSSSCCCHLLYQLSLY